MLLVDLIAYLKERHSLVEGWGVSYIPMTRSFKDPRSGEAIAYLSDESEEIERCDLRCGWQTLEEFDVPWISGPFRLNDPEWAGIRFTDETDPAIVFQLVDRAVDSQKDKPATIVLAPVPEDRPAVYRETPLPFTRKRSETQPDAPEKYREMWKIAEEDEAKVRAGELERDQSRVFYLQGKFMKDYEDDAPCDSPLVTISPTYEKLDLKQLRGYFTWRKEARKGIYLQNGATYAFIYLFELLNGIGATSPEDALEKINALEAGFVKGLHENDHIGKYLRALRPDFCIVNNMAPELVRSYMPSYSHGSDEKISILRYPKDRSDREIFDSLCYFGGDRAQKSIAIAKHGDAAVRLFAESWRIASERYRYGKSARRLFSQCFSERAIWNWQPLADAVYYDRRSPEPFVYELNDCRKFVYKDGEWRERYCALRDAKRIRGFLHETDRRLRLYWKTGRDLQEVAEDAWAAPYIDAAIEADRQARIEAAKPKVVIRFETLDQIREDAAVSCESLLTDADRREEELPEDVCETTDFAPAAPREETEDENDAVDRLFPAKEEKTPVESPCGVLDDARLRIVQALLRGESVAEELAAAHTTAELAADTINEAFFDEIGDSVVECDGEALTLFDDYRDDVARILKV